MADSALLVKFERSMKRLRKSRAAYVMSACDCIRDRVARDRRVDPLVNEDTIFLERSKDFIALRKLVRTKRWFGVGSFIDKVDYHSGAARNTISLLRRFGRKQRIFELSLTEKIRNRRLMLDDTRDLRSAARALYSKQIITIATRNESTLVCTLSSHYNWHGGVRIQAADESTKSAIADYLLMNGMSVV